MVTLNRCAVGSIHPAAFAADEVDNQQVGILVPDGESSIARDGAHQPSAIGRHPRKRDAAIAAYGIDYGVDILVETALLGDEADGTKAVT